MGRCVERVRKGPSRRPEEFIQYGMGQKRRDMGTSSLLVPALENR